MWIDLLLSALLLVQAVTTVRAQSLDSSSIQAGDGSPGPQGLVPCVGFDEQPGCSHVFASHTEGTGEHHRDAWPLGFDRLCKGLSQGRLLTAATPGVPPTNPQHTA